MLKTLLRKACHSLNSVETKELEALMGVIRNEKVKEEKPVTKGKKGVYPFYCLRRLIPLDR
jgi:hypothetical protein